MNSFGMNERSGAQVVRPQGAEALDRTAKGLEFWAFSARTHKTAATSHRCQLVSTRMNAQNINRS